jgi:hypothetical protein
VAIVERGLEHAQSVANSTVRIFYYLAINRGSREADGAAMC